MKIHYVKKTNNTNTGTGADRTKENWATQEKKEKKAKKTYGSKKNKKNVR